MINAIGLDAAREEEEDAVEGSTPGHEDHLPVSPNRISQTLQQGGDQHSSDEDSDTDSPMRATMAHDYAGECPNADGGMARSVSAIAVSHASTQQRERRVCHAKRMHKLTTYTPDRFFASQHRRNIQCPANQLEEEGSGDGCPPLSTLYILACTVVVCGQSLPSFHRF